MDIPETSSKISKPINKWNLALVVFWILWIAGVGTTLMLSWSAYNTSNPAAFFSSGTGVCATFSGYTPCTFWHFYFFDPYSHNLGVPWLLLLLGGLMIAFTIARIFSLSIKKSRVQS